MRSPLDDALEAEVVDLAYQHALQVTRNHRALVAALAAEGDEVIRDAYWRGFADGHLL